MFPQLTLTGTPHERGQQYGRHFASLIRHSIASYARMFAYYQGRDWATVQTYAAAYMPLLEDYAPELLEEMYGIAAGSERLLEEIVALNVRTELLAGAYANGRHRDYARVLARNREFGVPQHNNEPQASLQPASAVADMGECTTVAATPIASADGKTWLAQNWDWAGDQRTACVLLRVERPNKPTLITMTEAGIVAKVGLNSAGLAVTLNILASAHDGKQPGMPVHVLLRLLLEHDNMDAALALAKRNRSGASSCVTVADPNHAVSLEITPNGVGESHPEEGLLVHTNHCVCAVTQPNANPLPATSSSLPRYSRAAELMRQSHGAVDRERIIAVLTDHHDEPMCICRHPNPDLHPCDRTESVAGLIMDTQARVMHVSSDVPCATGFEAVAV